MNNPEIKRLEEEVDKLMKQLAEHRMLEMHLPRDLPQPKSLFYHSAFNPPECHILYDVQTLDEVKDLIGTIWNRTDVLPLSLCEDGLSTSFRTPYHGRSGKITPIFPVTVDVHDDMGIRFNMYVLSYDDTIIKITIKLEHSRMIAKVNYRIGTKYVSNVRLEYSEDVFYKAETVKWWSDRTSPNSFTMYWPNANGFQDVLK